MIVKKKIHSFSRIHPFKTTLRTLGLNTVCEEARCPNIEECFMKGHTTIIALGKTCTRRCGFCNVWTGSKKDLISPEEEIEKITDFIKKTGTKYLVVTSVTRDDLPDGGAGFFSNLAVRLKKNFNDLFLEFLIPDFKGIREYVQIVSQSPADVIGNNVETVERLYPEVRPSSSYKRVLNVLQFISEIRGEAKSAVLLGLGETAEELEQLFKDLKYAGVTSLVIGQYFRPSLKNIEVRKFYSEEEILKIGDLAKSTGIREVKAGRFYRSSYRVF